MCVCVCVYKRVCVCALGKLPMRKENDKLEREQRRFWQSKQKPEEILHPLICWGQRREDKLSPVFVFPLEKEHQSPAAAHLVLVNDW